MIRVTRAISFNESELDFDFIRSSGPGGQNVNKVATGVQLRFNVRDTTAFSDEVRARLTGLAGRRMTRDGVLVITARRHRTQERNRQDAIARLVELISEASKRPRKRRPTRPTRASREDRIAEKKHRGRVKRTRGRVRDDD